MTVNNIAVADGSSQIVAPNDSTHIIDMTGTNLSGYDVSITGDVRCPANLGDSITDVLNEGENITCIITTNDIAPTLKLIKVVIEDNNGGAEPDDFTLFANATAPNDERNFSNAGGSGVFEIIFANAGYDLSESGVEGFAADNWSCDGGSLAGSTVTLAEGEDVICTIENDDIPPGLTIEMILINGDDGTALPEDFVLSATGPSSFSNIGPSVSSDDEIVDFLAGIYDLNATGVDSYEYGSWSCVGGDQLDSDTVSFLVGDTILCTTTIAFDDNCPDVLNPDQTDTDGNGIGDSCEDENNGGMNHWDTRPTFGVNHETRETMLVDNGFTFNGNSLQ